MKKVATLITMTAIILILKTVFSASKQEEDFIKIWHPEADDTITCQLEVLARVEYESGKIKKTSHKEKAKTSSVFTNLKSNNPKMIKPDKIDLIKIKEHNGTYWLLSTEAVTAIVLFIIDTKRKVMIQQRSVAIGRVAFYGHSWMGRCL